MKASHDDHGFSTQQLTSMSQAFKALSNRMSKPKISKHAEREAASPVLIQFSECVCVCVRVCVCKRDVGRPFFNRTDTLPTISTKQAEYLFRKYRLHRDETSLSMLISVLITTSAIDAMTCAWKRATVNLVHLADNERLATGEQTPAATPHLARGHTVLLEPFQQSL
jgi:hypothetical protein